MGRMAQSTSSSVKRLPRRPIRTPPGRVDRELPGQVRNPYVAAARGYLDDVIEPHETRPRLIEALAMLQNKRDANPQKARQHSSLET